MASYDSAGLFFGRVLAMAREHGWTNEPHFKADETLIDAGASFKPKNRS